MPVGKQRIANYQDLKALPEHQIGELVGSELFVSPRPSYRHARASSVLGGVLGGPFDFGRGGPGGWLILDEPELHLGTDVVVPDLAGWRRERALKDDVPFFTDAPDWACEVLSPSTASLDRLRKKHIYARENVRHVWLIDPGAKLLEVYRLESEHWVEVGTFGGEERVRAEPFDAIELALADLWL
jgi:Uma2 family endonuclease